MIRTKRSDTSRVREGNTKKLADSVASAMGTSAESIDVSLDGPVDILFLGSSVYAGGFDPTIKTFIENNADKIGIIALFGSSASGSSNLKKISELARQNGIDVFPEAFTCPGHFLFLHRKRPNSSDLEGVAEFARNVINAKK